MFRLTDKEFERIKQFTKENYGINLDNKKVFVETRLSIMLYEKGFKNFSQYIDMIMDSRNVNEIYDFINNITTNHTFFLREMEHFDYLYQEVLPYFEKSLREKKDLRIWSAGCSSGQEAYTLAMIIDDYFGERKEGWDTTLLASDISVNMLNKAQKGVYLLPEISSVSKKFLNKYFSLQSDGSYKICDKIRKQVVFKKINLMDTFSFSEGFHIIFCRNVMIYYDEDTRNNLVNKFYNITKDNGFLFIGNSENIRKEATKFNLVKQSIFTKNTM